MLSPELSKSQAGSSLGAVLVVEDEAIIRETIALALKDEGYEVLIAEDGYSALGMTQRNEHIDLMVLDVMLPYVSGLDLCRIIRKDGSNIPVLMVSAKGSRGRSHCWLRGWR
jgi:two-component system phosphate regulon response regulator PhoB